MYKLRKRWRRVIAPLVAALTMAVCLAPVPARADEDVPEWARDTGEQAEAVFTAQADLPTSFDLRQSFPNNLTPVRCQNPFSTCWAFGGIAAAETSIAADFNTPVDLSERHLIWFAMHPVTDVDVPTSQAGEGMYVFDEDPEKNPNAAYIATNPTLVTSLFSTGVGPVLEEDFPYRGKAGLTEYEYTLTHKEEWKEDSRQNLLASFKTEDALLAAILARRTELSSVDEFLDTVWQDTVDKLKNGESVNCYSDKDDWSIDPVDENGESNRNVFAGYTLRDGNLLPAPITKDDKGNVSLNEAGMQAMKQELMRGRAISICICADTSSPGETGEAKYTNENTWASYVYDGSSSNHSVAIVGWDDNYATSNFNQGEDTLGRSKTPPAAGAWIAKNSWGCKDGVGTKQSEEYGEQVIGKESWGVDGSGYFYISYYDTSLANPEAMTFDTDLVGEEFYTHAYDYLPAYDGFCILEGRGDNVLSSANVFTAALDEKITSVSTRTDELNSRVTFAIYLLNDDAKDPTDGTLVERFSRTYGYAGFHRADLESPVRLREGDRFSVVSSVTYVDADGATVYETVSNRAISKEYAERLKGTEDERSQYGKAVVNRGESYIYEGGAWKDWVDKREEEDFQKNADGYDVDNFSIKAYALPTEAAAYACTEGDEAAWTQGSSEGLTFTFEETTEHSRPRFSRAEVDGGELDPAVCSVGDTNMTVTLSADYLSGLSEGTHSLVVFFVDGDSVTVEFKVIAKKEPAGEESGDDNGNDDGGSEDDGNSEPATAPGTSNPGAPSPTTGSSGTTPAPGTTAAPASGGTTTAAAPVSRTSGTMASSAPTGRTLARTGDATSSLSIVLALGPSLALLVSGLLLRRRWEGQ